MDVRGLTVRVLQNIAVAAVQYSRPAVNQSRGMASRLRAPASRLDAYQLHRRVADEWVKDPRRIAAAADTSHYYVRQPTKPLQALLPCLAADDRLEVPDDQRKRVRANDAAD